MADNARAAEWRDIRPEDDGRLFYQKKSWQKLIIMAGGPMMNILLAFVILLGVTATYGVYRTQLTVSRVQECIVAGGRDRHQLRGQAADPGRAVRASSRATGSSPSTARPVSSWERDVDADPRQPRPAGADHASSGTASGSS